mmetsp:Transcript_11841/g.51000  ORF Transcript_11841/g.51000 Transcript_11841/m.51000 type:complete len:222 (-) Transcript_11841:465-1130(-)
MSPGEAKPMPGPRARYHLERIRESVWDVVANGALKITYGELKKGLDENKDVSWERTGLDGAKVRRAVTLECQAAGDETPVDFDEFHALACRRGGPSDDGFVDPVLATQMYMETHKLVPLLESMTAAVMTAKPDDPAKFLEQKLRDHHFRGAPVLGYDEKDLDAVFHQFDIVRSGAITQEQCDKAIIAMTGHKAKPRTDPGAPVTKAEFMRLAREALDEYTA